MIDRLLLSYYSWRFADCQNNGKKSDSIEKHLDRAIFKWISKGHLEIKCCDKVYPLPLKNFFYLRPIFKLKTHRLIPEVQADDRNAVDFDVPVGTEVFAAASGKVVVIKNDSNIGGNDPAYQNEDNHLYIYNAEENQIYCYRHMNPLMSIKLNNMIEKNQLLGYVSLTGYVITPHLHFVIYRIQDDKKIKLKSLKIKLY